MRGVRVAIIGRGQSVEAGGSGDGFRGIGSGVRSVSEFKGGFKGVLVAGSRSGRIAGTGSGGVVMVAG